MYEDAGEIFDDKHDVINAIKLVADNHSKYKSRISVVAFEEIGNSYYNFARQIYIDAVNGEYSPKRITLSKSVIIKYKNIRILLQKFKEKFLQN